MIIATFVWTNDLTAASGCDQRPLLSIVRDRQLFERLVAVFNGARTKRRIDPGLMIGLSTFPSVECFYCCSL